MRGRPSDNVASMWKWQSMKGGDTRRPVASITLPASAEMPASMRGDLAAGTGDIDALAAVGKIGVLDQQVDGHQRSSFLNGISRLAGARALRDTSAIATMVMTNGSMRKTS